MLITPYTITCCRPTVFALLYMMKTVFICLISIKSRGTKSKCFCGYGCRKRRALFQLIKLELKNYCQISLKNSRKTFTRFYYSELFLSEEQLNSRGISKNRARSFDGDCHIKNKMQLQYHIANKLMKLRHFNGVAIKIKKDSFYSPLQTKRTLKIVVIFSNARSVVLNLFSIAAHFSLRKSPVAH